MPKRKTDAKFKKEVFDLVGNEYTFLDSYINSYTKIKVKHNKCGNTYEVKPHDFLQVQCCPYCYGHARKTNTQFQQEVFNLVGDEYVFLNSYINDGTKIKVKHNKCGNTYEVKPNHFLQGHRCPYCYGNTKKTSEQFKQEVLNLVGNEYELLDDYVNAKTKIRIKHSKCGNIYKVTPSHFIGGRRCPCCSEKMKKTDAQFKQEVYNLVGNEYEPLDDYVNTRTKIRVKHNNCGNIYKVQPYLFLQGSRCPYCKSPKGEVLINKILKSLGINYEPQKTFDDLKDTGLLSYDFYIPDQNILIEYQGRQHYQPIDYFGGKPNLKSNKSMIR